MVSSKMMSKAARRGISLVEVMSAMVVTTLMGAAALPAITSEIRRAKTLEARANIEGIARAVNTYYQLHGILPPTTTASVPAAVADVANKVYQVAADDLTGSFNDIGWAPDGPVRYCYKITTTGSFAEGDSVVISAAGDLDGDAVESKFEIKLVIVEGILSRAYYDTATPPVATALAAGASGSGARPIGITDELE